MLPVSVVEWPATPELKHAVKWSKWQGEDSQEAASIEPHGHINGFLFEIDMAVAGEDDRVGCSCEVVSG